MNALRAEWIKFSTLMSNKAMWLVALLFPTVIVILIAILANEPTDSRELTELISGFGMVSVMVLAVLAVVSITGEHAHGTIRPTFAAQPRRVTPLVAKLVVMLLVALVTIAVTIAICWIGFTLLAVEPYGGAGFPFWELRGNRLATPAVFGGLLIVTTGMVLFGFGAGMLLRNVGAAVALVLLWPLVAEGLVALLLGQVFKIDEPGNYLPTTQGFSLISVSRDGMDTSRLYAAVYFLAWSTLVYVLGVVRANRSDA